MCVRPLTHAALIPQREARRDLTEMARCIALSTVSNAPDASALAGELYAADAKAQAADAERPTPESGAGDDASMEASVASSPSREDSATQRQRGGRLSPGHTAGSAASFRNQLMLPEWCGVALWRVSSCTLTQKRRRLL